MATTFTKTERVYDGATGVSTVSTTSVTGSAFQKRDDPRRYEQLGLTVSDAITLVFIPTTYGSLPSVGSRTTWGSSPCIVRAVEPLAPDGVTLLAYITMQREAS